MCIYARISILEISIQIFEIIKFFPMTELDNFDIFRKKAIKILNELVFDSSEDTIDEIKVLKRLNSEYIIYYYECFKENDFTICIITEYCPVGIIQKPEFLNNSK